MGYLRAEEVTLPMRFLVMTAHFIAVVTVLFDLNALTGQMLQLDGTQPQLYSQPGFLDTKQRLYSLACASMACFAVEYFSLFMGISIFMRGHTCLYILLHFAGTVLTALFYSKAWEIGAFATSFAIFNCLPAALELLTLAFVARISFFTY